MTSQQSTTAASSTLPEGYVAVPLGCDQAAAPLKVCALVRREPESVGGSVVVLRETLDARVILGVVLDAGGSVHDWVEIWIQTLDAIPMDSPGHVAALSNAVLDRRWEEFSDARAKADPGGVYVGGWERANVRPIFADPSSGACVHPTASKVGDQSEGEATAEDAPRHWSLCTDDDVLQENDLPAYSTSLHRYLYLDNDEKSGPFVPVTTSAPEPLALEDLATIARLPDGTECVPINPGGGRMFVQSFAPTSYEDFVGILRGDTVPTLNHGRQVLDIPGLVQGGEDLDSLRSNEDGRLFLGRAGRWGRIVEGLHLQLRLLGGAVDEVSKYVASTQRPILNLSADSFQVQQSKRGPGLPVLWSHRVSLVDGGDAVELSMPGSQEAIFLAGPRARTSVYRPHAGVMGARGSCAVRIRKVIGQENGWGIIEGTMRTQETLAPSASDVVWLRCNVGGRRIDLHVRVQADTAMSASELRFRSVERAWGSEMLEVLSSAEGVPLPESTFEILPVLSTPCDLYSLGVLMVRTLLVNNDTSLPIALDELLSLANEVAYHHDPEVGLRLRIQGIFDGDERWAKSLGPQRLSEEEMTSAEAFSMVPGDVWFDVLAMIIRAFPGVGPDSSVRDFGDARPGALQAVFETLRGDLDELLRRTRSLIVVDWKFNREVSAVLRRFLVGTSVGSDEAFVGS